jgi:hypothetical protein
VTSTDAPTAEVVQVAPVATDAPLATDTPAPAATKAPAVLGVVSSGGDCPSDHPVKGNIVDRGANKGDKIYHVPGSSSYKATNPERCFVDVAEAKAAGFRAPK